MASVFSHAVAALGIGACFYKRRVPKRVWLVGAACSVIPDLDVLGFRFGIRYGDFLGHRGFSHSLVFAALLASVVVAIGFRRGVPGMSQYSMWLYCFLATSSHGLLDAMTDGGLGVAFFAPFNNHRYFLPWRPIRVSPIAVGRFFTARGFVVLKSELIWIWLPAIILASIALALRRNKPSPPPHPHRIQSAMRISDVERGRLRDVVNARLESAPNLNYLLGEVIRARIDHADDPTSNLVTLLSQNSPHYWLREMEELCTRYLAALVNRDDAIARVRDELLKGARAMLPKPFNNRMAGFIAELAALGELPPRGYSHFIPIPTSTLNKTADYECRIDNVPACLEIKNINSPFGIFDVFDEMLGQRKKTSGYFRSISLKLECDDDNTATEIQKAEITRFLDAIDGGPTQGIHELSLPGEVKMRVEVQPGEGRVYMFRGCILGTVRNVREDKFFEKVRSTVVNALPQLAKCPHQQRGVVLNIITPDAEFPMEWNTRIRNIVNEVSGGSVICEILFFHKYLDPGLAAGVAVEISE